MNAYFELLLSELNLIMTDIFEIPTPDNELLEKAKELRLASIKTLSLIHI